MFKTLYTAISLIIFLCIFPKTFSEEVNYDLSFEELMNVTVTTVSGTEETISKTPSAITVITAEDIKKQGHKTIADALRSVPGMHVAQTNSQNYGVASRGFTDRFSTMMLVLIDGRSVYTPIFSGVFWDVQDVMLEDIDRIEVIRGPGATLWGANAVNGVVNIITKSSFDTVGNLLTTGVGTYEQGFINFRHGSELNSSTAYRIYGKFFNRDNTLNDSDDERPDDWSYINTGFRLDYQPNIFETISIQGNAAGTNHYGEGTIRPDLTPPTPSLFPGHSNPAIPVQQDAQIFNSNILLSWKKETNEDEGFQVKTFYDLESRKLEILDEETHRFDIDFRQWLQINEKNKFIYGLGYRRIYTDLEESDTITFDPSSHELNLFSAFLQNTTQLTDKLSLMLGSKFEHNDLSHFNAQPSIRLNYLIDDHNQVWTAISRAVRTPSLVERDISLRRTVGVGGGLSAHAFLVGSEETKANKLTAYEMGYRSKINEKLSLDFAVFYNDYTNLTTFESQSNPLIVSGNSQNEGESYGFEGQVKYQINENWDVMTSYTYYKLELDSEVGGTLANSENYFPHNMVNLISNYQINKALSFHLAAYYYDNVNGFNIPHYIKVDSGLIWAVSSQLELQLWGKNLLEKSHREFRDDVFEDETHQIERSFYIQASYKFQFTSYNHQ